LFCVWCQIEGGIGGKRKTVYSVSTKLTAPVGRKEDIKEDHFLGLLFSPRERVSGEVEGEENLSSDRPHEP